MQISDIKDKIDNAPEYKFLKTNPQLGDSIIMLGVGGSHAYGTNIEGSDIDVRGVAMNSKKELLTTNNFEQVVNNETDTTIYSFNKLVQLITNCNPNTIELLGLRDEQYFQLNDLGKQLLENKNIFLSQRAIHSFGGYANSQLRRLQNFLARHEYSQGEKEQHILGSIKHSMWAIKERYKDYGEDGFKMYVDKAETEDLDEEVFLDFNLQHYPLRDFRSIIGEMNSVVRGYEKLGKRNTKKTEEKVGKHAMHLIRLYLMGIDILEKEQIITYRENDLELLMKIRNGEFQYEDGKFRDEFFELVDEYEKKFNYACEHTNLPKKPRIKEIQEFQMEMNEAWIQKQ